MTLNYDHFVLLVNLCINDFVLDGLDSPEFNLFDLDLAQQKTVSKDYYLGSLSAIPSNTYIEKFGQFTVGEVCDLRVQSADLHIGLLHNELLLGESLILHEVLILPQLRLELFGASLCEQV